MAINSQLDVAILATTDTDLRPALEAFHVLPFENPPVAEVATFKSAHFSKKLQVPGRHVWTHFIEQAEYRTVQDRTDYNNP